MRGGWNVDPFLMIMAATSRSREYGAELYPYPLPSVPFQLHGVKGNKVPVADCTSFFLRDDTGLEWLAGLSDVEGKLSCPHPKCGVRIGSFNWSGTQCSCELIGRKGREGQGGPYYLCYYYYYHYYYYHC